MAAPFANTPGAVWFVPDELLDSVLFTRFSVPAFRIAPPVALAMLLEIVVRLIVSVPVLLTAPPSSCDVLF